MTLSELMELPNYYITQLNGHTVIENYPEYVDKTLSNRHIFKIWDDIKDSIRYVTFELDTNIIADYKVISNLIYIKDINAVMYNLIVFKGKHITLNELAKDYLENDNT